MRLNLFSSLLLFALLSFGWAQISEDLRFQLYKVQKNAATWSKTINGSVSNNCMDPTPQNPGDGDSTLWNGLMCISGEESFCEAVFRSQGEDGRIWRSPRRVGLDTVNSFSRDMGEGVLCALTYTGNLTLGTKWGEYINVTKALCPDADTGNQRCWVVPSFYCHVKIVADAVGFPELSPDYVFNFTEAACIIEDYVLLFTAEHDEGFGLHLVGVNLFYRQHLNIWNDVLQATADALHERQPLNPFFHYLAAKMTYGINDQVAQTALNAMTNSACPTAGGTWSWQRSDEQLAWLHKPCGHDYIFMTNLLLKS